jgi:muramidase (phage lysozyme)
VNAINRVGANYGPYEVKITSGLRTGKGESFHGKGQALDVALIDRATGKKLPNYQNAQSVAAYQQFANAVYADAQKNDPALASRLRWGGYFGNDAGTGKPKYGSFDLMHFDEGGHVGMRGGSWKEGFTPEMQKYWKIPAQAGGAAGAATGTAVPDVQAGAGPAAVAAAQAADAKAAAAGPSGKDPNAMRKAFLATIATGEAPKGAYDYIIGGGRAKDLSQHPNVTGSAGRYGSSTAAGQYQFLKSTWDEQAAKYGYKDFKPETQDTAAWNYAKDVYKQKSGRDLETDLASGDPKTLNNISSTLGQTWTSLPGGTQPNSNWKDKDFASVYSENLKGSGTTTEYPDPTPNVGAGESAYPAAPLDPTPNVGAGAGDYTPTTSPGVDTSTAAAKTDYGKGAGDIFSAMGDLFSKGPVAQNAARPSGPANLPVPILPVPPNPIPTVDPRVAQAQRQQLAMALQRLNSGKLV